MKIPEDHDFTEVPILANFDQGRPIGWLRIRTDALPPTPDYVFSLGFEAKVHVREDGSRVLGAYKLHCVSLVANEAFAAYLERNKRPAQATRLDPSGAPMLPATLLERSAVYLLNCVKAWRDSDGNEPFPAEVREGIDALLMMAEVRRTGLATSDPEGHRQAMADHEAEPAPTEVQGATTGECMMALAVVRELTGTQQADLDTTIAAVRAAVSAQKEAPAAEPVATVDADGFLVVLKGEYIPTGAPLFLHPRISDEAILAAWRAWPRTGITSSAKALEFFRYVEDQAATPPTGEVPTWPDKETGNLVLPLGLEPNTALLVTRFANALADKLMKAQDKYGYEDGWRSPDWLDECRQHLREHLEKGDPRDVAAYCAFLWHHGASTATQPPEVKPAPALLQLINDYGRACRRDGNPAWESNEGQALKAALAAQEKPAALPVLTDDMLRYAMASLGSGSPSDAERFRLFWRFAGDAFTHAQQRKG